MIRAVVGFVLGLAAVTAFAAPNDICFEGFTGTKEVYSIDLSQRGTGQCCGSQGTDCTQQVCTEPDPACCDSYVYCEGFQCCAEPSGDACAENRCLVYLESGEILNCARPLPCCGTATFYADCRLNQCFCHIQQAVFVTPESPCVNSDLFVVSQTGWMRWLVLREPGGSGFCGAITP